MQPENNNQIQQPVEQPTPLHQVTPLSKYLAMALFIILPFVGGWIGYTFAPEKVVEIEVIKEVEKIDEEPGQITEESPIFGEMYMSPNGYSISLPSGVSIEEEPAQFSNSALTRYEGEFGSLCISLAYGCGGVGLQGWTQSDESIISADGTEMEFIFWTRGEEVYLNLNSLQPIPAALGADAQIQLRTTVSQLDASRPILSSIDFSKSDMSSGNVIEGGDAIVYRGDRVIVIVANVNFTDGSSERIVTNFDSNITVLDSITAAFEAEGRTVTALHNDVFEVTYNDGVYSGDDIIMVR